ncbi:pleiotropic drug resistance ABC transporter protein [Favolaschia claudopus]|uniref:Pleiotropic drug resistance ABC transporter protein n=1 Tax=Favolaschia claudopus TaxID=2862362 RepID=A0AAW0EH22_9AGAR
MTDTAKDSTQVQEKGNSTPPRSPTSPFSVNVAQAEEEFNALSRQLTRHSQAASSGATTRAASDLEKAVDQEAPFDLREYLTSSNDAQQAAGIKHKHVGVTWDDLEVKVGGGVNSKIYVGTFGGAVLNFFLAIPLYLWYQVIAPFFFKQEGPSRVILHKQSGMLKSGEMCLVLGCPGSGCTTFLKTVANERQTFGNVAGDVLYEGIDAHTMKKYYKGEVVYNHEDDRHIATLTVAQTLAFALSTKTPGPNGRLPGVSRKEFDAEVQDTLLRMLNISHTKQTLVGDEFVRGVSGGERKRVSIAEMMATRARVQSWDNSTRGLDASTALDYVKCLRIMTDILGQTTFVTLYQAGEGIYDLFDKVMVLSEGRQVFFGKPTEARAYFESLGYKPLPRQSTADYLTGCTDPNERQFAPGRSAHDTPSTPEALESVFQSSQVSRGLDDDREKYKLYMETERADQEAFREAVAADKKKGVSKKSPYTLGFTGQVRALTVRQFQMRLQDKFQLYTSFALSTVLSIVLGAAFLNLPTTSAGAFTRGGVIFAALLTTCLDAFGEMPTQMLGRPILRKQTSYSMYRPSALALANTFADLPFSAARVLIFNIPVYFMAHLSRTAGGFWTFHLFNYVAYLAMQGFFRTFGVLCTNFHVAFRLSVFFIPNFVEYTGYIIPVIKMKRWLFWIYYVNPIAYAWQACIENEFMRIQLTCDGAYVIPRNIGPVSKYPDTLGPNQACTLFGASAGSNIVDGESYISAGYGLSSSNLWKRNLLVLLAFMIVFQLTQIISLEYFPAYDSDINVEIFAREDDDAKKRNELAQARKAEKSAALQAANSSDPAVGDDEKTKSATTTMTPAAPAAGKPKKILTWSELNYHVPVPGGTKRLLHDVQGYVGPGLTALMGASGAGKTTCLDVLAQRKNIGVVSGEILLGGRPLSSDFARGTAYAEQMDVHEGTATVREALRFSAYLRQPAEIPTHEKDDYVEELLELLELQDLSEALIFSLSAESRKRLTIGVELASKPELLLYLDEPTSGLDSQSAWNIVRFLRKLADQGQAILCTIHQPSSLLFESFDRLLLLERGGETVYCGPIGKDSAVLRDYFASRGAVCPSDVNPAEYMLEAIGAGTTPRVGDRDWKDIWLESPECQKLRDEIEAIKKEGLALTEPDKKDQTTYATPFWYQLRTVTYRNALSLWRSPDYLFSRLFVCAFISLFVSLSFLNLGVSTRDLQFRVFSLFWVSILPAIVMAQIEPLFIANRRIFIREASSRIYSPYVFAVSQTISEIPGSIVCGIVYWVLLVYPQGFGQGAAGTNGTGFQLLVTLFMMMFGVSLGQLVAAISPSVQVAVLFNPFLTLVLTTFCGVTIPHVTDSYWWTWLYQLVPYTRSIAAMVSTELHGLKIRCKSDEFAVFNPPSNSSCSQWAQDFVNVAGGYLDNPDDSTNCRYCTYAVGDEFYTPLGIRYSLRWRDAFIFLAFVGFNIIATIIASRYLRYAKR